MIDPTVAVIVQARLNSKRFPRKILAEINGKPLLWHVLTRAHKIHARFRVLAIPAGDSEELEAIAREAGFEVWADGGAEEDVLARYHNAATWLRLGSDEYIVRITADCPLIDPDRCNRLIYGAVADRAIYRSNVWPARGVPSGLDCEIFTMRALTVANRFATESYDREHVTPFIRGCVEELAKCPPPNGMSWETEQLLGAKCSIDTPGDFERVRTIMEKQAADETRFGL